MRKNTRRGLILAAVCLVGLVVGWLVFHFAIGATDRIPEAEAAQAAADVLGAMLVGETKLQKNAAPIGGAEVYRAVSADSVQGVAAVFTSPKGYAGEIRLMLGFDPGGNLRGMKVLRQQEHPDKGGKIATDEAWRRQLLFREGQPRNLENTDWRLKADGGEIDALSGATISSQAVVATVQSGLAWFREHRVELVGEATGPTPPPATPETPTPDPRVEEGGVTDSRLPAAVPLPKVAKTPPPITGKDLTE